MEVKKEKTEKQIKEEHIRNLKNILILFNKKAVFNSLVGAEIVAAYKAIESIKEVVDGLEKNVQEVEQEIKPEENKIDNKDGQKKTKELKRGKKV